MTGSPADLGRLRILRDQPGPGQRRALKFALVLAGVAVILITIVVVMMRGPAATDVRVALAEVAGGGSGNGRITAGGSVGITANGYVVARTRASVSSRVAGRLAALHVEEGSRVRRGQVLARLENADYEAALAQAEADSLRTVAALHEAQASRGQLARDLARARDLVAKNLEATRAAEELESQLAAADARVASQRAVVRAAGAAMAYARANLEFTYIRAPFDGTVLRKDAEVGEVVAPVATGGGLTRGAVVTMADLETLEVEVDVNEAYIAQIRDSQPARVVLDAYPSASFQAEVRQIVPTADRQRATVQVKVRLTERDPRILPEMGARVDFLETASAEAAGAPRVFVAAAAVRTQGNTTVVWVVREGRVARVAIQAGPVSGGRREVRSGLTGGERVVLDPPQGLSEGARVNVLSP